MDIQDAMVVEKRAAESPESAIVCKKRVRLDEEQSEEPKRKLLTAAEYRERLLVQGKYHDSKPGSRARDGELKDPPLLPPLVRVLGNIGKEPERRKNGTFSFPDCPEFSPNLSPQQVLQMGAFGGTYFRDIISAVTGHRHHGLEIISEFPKEWFAALDLEKQVTSQTYQKAVNHYKVACGGSLGMWETSGWIAEADPYGWFQWYCRFYLGRRSSDDDRQIDRWMKGQGPKGRWRVQLMNKIIKVNAQYDDIKISPVMRQVLLHWAYELTPGDLQEYRERQAIA